jgi:hypothetical protein
VLIMMPPGPAARADGPTVFVQAAFDAFHVHERGGNDPSHGPAVRARPVVGATGEPFEALRVTGLGGVTAARYGQTPANDTDLVFAMVTVSRPVAGWRVATSVLAAHGYDPTFSNGVATTVDATVSLSRAFALPMDGWTLGPVARLRLRRADLASAERTDFGLGLELGVPLLGGALTVGGGYSRFDYRTDDRRDDQIDVEAVWLVDLDKNVSAGLRSSASFTRSTMAGKSVDSYEIGPTLRVLFAR